MLMDEATTALADQPHYLYKPTPKETDLQYKETSGLQRIQGSPRIWYADIEGDGAGIFKLHKYSDTQNERAAYVISTVVGFDFVPPTVLRKIDGEEGSLQEFVEDGKPLDEVELTDEVKSGLYKYWIFGHIIRNMERSDWNLLVEDDKVISIDHDASFDPDFADSSNFDLFRHYYNEEAPSSLVETFKSYLGDRSRQEALKSALQDLLNPEDIEITMQRLEHIGNLLIKNGKINSQADLKI